MNPPPFKDKYSKPSPIEELFLKILPDQGFFPAPSPIEDTTLPVWLLNLKNLPIRGKTQLIYVSMNHQES